MSGKEPIHFTKSSVEALPIPDSGRARYRDNSTPGLTVEVTHTGRKTFRLVKKVQGRSVYVTLGVFGTMSVSGARLAAGDHAVRLAKDDGAIRRSQRLPTFGEVFNLWINGYARQHKRTWEDDVYNYNRYLQERIGRRKIDQISKAEVARIHGDITRRGPYQANRILALMTTVFNYAIHNLDHDIRNPCNGIRKNKERSRDRYMDAAEIGRFLEALNDPLTPPLWRDFFMVMMMTGARCGNVRAMAWEDIDLERGIWTIPAEQAKGGDVLKVVLAPPVVEILEKRRPTRSQWVFPSPRKPAQHINSPKGAWAAILRRADITSLRIHDLRRTFGSWQAASGSSILVIGKSLGHRSTAATEIYSQLDLAPVRASVQSAVAAMLSCGEAGMEPEQES